ncbi:MAG TPA: YebC/PmpR family DNA-binding transcriptional regulator [Bryobacteraceae bacterium]|nr:YebC/PmpR family DNA-binding transcriptional regulator [Bryobacteraceae bacterium]
MSGHSKWHTIKHKKAALDAKRGKVFTRLIKEIVIAARGGGDPTSNARLRTAITAAKAVSMPQDNIMRAVKRGTGELEGATIEEFVYEGYGPGGAAVMVKVATDNKNRTVSDIRHVFSKNGGNMAEPGAVGWMFEMKSNILVDGEGVTEEKLMDVALEAGAEDIRNNGDSWQVISDPSSHNAVLEALQAASISVTESEATALVPKNTVNLEGKDATAMMKLFDAIDDHDDVQNVYGNFEIGEDAEVDG